MEALLFDALDSSDEELEFVPFDFSFNNLTFNYEDPLLLTGLLRAVVEGDYNKVLDLVKSGRSVNINDNNGNTPLHIAVIKNNIEILKFLVSQDEIVINTRNFVGETPLFQASKLGRYECLQILINAGANVNITNHEERNPLHVAYNFPNVAQLLILNGANLNACDYSGDMPLHDAIAEGCLETVCLFLYYEADANALGGNDLTPFMKAIIGENFDIQDALFNYVSDFDIESGDGISLLALALIHDSPYTKNIIEMDVNISKNSVFFSLQCSTIENFKLIWDRFKYDYEESISLTDIINSESIDKSNVDTCINIILDSPNTDLLQEIVPAGTFHYFIDQFYAKNFDSEILTKVMCVILTNSYTPTTVEVHKIFSYYGYCELIYILLFMECQFHWLPYMLTTRLLFDIHNNVVQIPDNLIYQEMNRLSTFKNDSLNFLSYCVDNKLLQMYSNHCKYIENLRPKIPSLVQLARDKSREYLIKSFNISTCSQYYTIINSLDIAQIYKNILNFKKKLYVLENFL